MEIGKESKVNLSKLANAFGGLGKGACGVQVVEQGVRGFDGRLIDGQKSLVLVSDDEREAFVCCDGATVEVIDVDDWGLVTVRTTDDRADWREFELEEDDAIEALAETA